LPWRRIGEQDASLDKTLKEYEKTSAKLDKASSKAKSSKADALSSELDQLTSSLSSLSPMVYTTYQKLDEERLKGLKEVIVRWGTVRADMATRDGERAERAVAGILGWETGDEVLAVGTRLGGVGGARGAGSAPSISAATTREWETTTGADASSLKPTNVLGNGHLGLFSSTEHTPKWFLLQRVSAAQFIRWRYQVDAWSYQDAGGRSNSQREQRDIGAERSRQRGRVWRHRRRRAFAVGQCRCSSRCPLLTPQAPPVDDEGFSVAPADRHRNPWEEPNEEVLTPAIQPTAPTAVPAPPPSAAFSQTFSSSPDHSQDDLSIPSSQNQAQPRLNLAIAPAPIQETEEERQAALAKMQQALSLPPSQPTRRSTVARGRRDVRNTMFAGAGEDPMAALGAQAAQSPVAETLQDGEPVSPSVHANGEKPAMPRQASMNSVGSNNPFETPGLGAGLPLGTVSTTTAEPGLRASLVETINAITKDGQVQRIQINGEIHLSLRIGVSADSGPIHIRLTSFEQLEKIAPNPAYLAQVPDRPGEYFLNPEVLASVTTQGPSKGTLLFKYQVHVPPGQESSVLPLILEPAFMCKDGETRMILHYRGNSTPAYSSAKFHDLTLLAAFAPGPSVSNVQAKPPGGVWSPPTRKMTWKVDDFAGAEGKIIARFTTEPGEPMVPQGIQASWALEGVLGSGLGIEVVEGDLEGRGWKFEEVKKGLTTGKYLAEPNIN
jgi:hypothetical protein